VTIATFEELCAGFCELAQVPSPTLAPDSDGLTAMHVVWQGVSIDVVYVPAKAHELAFIIFELGPIHSQPHSAALIMHALLQANFLSLEPHPPTFACDAMTGEAVLQCTFPIINTTPEKLTAVIEQGVRMALSWRKDFFLADALVD
jgi:hypothetical protein